MTFAWLTLDLVLIVLFAFSLPATFLYVIRRWLQQSEQAETRRESNSSEGRHAAHS